MPCPSASPNCFGSVQNRFSIWTRPNVHTENLFWMWPESFRSYRRTGQYNCRKVICQIYTRMVLMYIATKRSLVSYSCVSGNGQYLSILKIFRFDLNLSSCVIISRSIIEIWVCSISNWVHSILLGFFCKSLVYSN